MDAKIRSSLRNRNFRLHGSGNEKVRLPTQFHAE